MFEYARRWGGGSAPPPGSAGFPTAESALAINPGRPPRLPTRRPKCPPLLPSLQLS